jgi:hypothetical protein
MVLDASGEQVMALIKHVLEELLPRTNSLIRAPLHTCPDFSRGAANISCLLVVVQGSWYWDGDSWFSSSHFLFFFWYERSVFRAFGHIPPKQEVVQVMCIFVLKIL